MKTLLLGLSWKAPYKGQDFKRLPDKTRADWGRINHLIGIGWTLTSKSVWKKLRKLRS